MSFRIFLCQQVTDISFCIPTDNIIIFFREKIISHGMQANTPTGYSSRLSKVWLMLPNFPEVTKING